MILHLIPDSVFTDFVINKFNHLDANNHKFLILSNTDKLIYTKSENVDIINEKSLLTKDFLQYLKNFSYIVVHSMFSKYVKKMILKSENDFKFVWIGWGGDYYETVAELKKNLYDLKTVKLMQPSLQEKLKRLIKKFIPYLGIDMALIYKRIEYFAPVIYDEYDLLEKLFKPIHTKYLPFSYGQLENDFLKGIENLNITSNNILLGNSASYTNNHLSILHLLAGLDLKDRKIITPLSYGDEKYKKIILNYGKELLYSNFYPQIDFLEKHEYHKLIASCSICIMNHKRQQSMGNIISMIYLGSKLFLNKENIVYKFLKREGAIVYSIDEINNDSLNSSLTSNEIQINREILKKNWSEDSVNQKYREFIRILTS